VLAESIDIGPFNLPVWLAAALLGYLAALVVPRFLALERRPAFSIVHDALSTGVLAGFLVWKIMPLLTRFPEIRTLPRRLLFYPGGTVGLVAGLVAGAAIAAWSVRRTLRKRESAGETRPAPRSLAVAAGVVLGCMVLPVAITAAIPNGTAGVEQEVTNTRDIRPIDELLAGNPRAPTVLVFWATWCGPCSAQMPEIQRFQDEFGDRVNLLAVNLTNTEQSRTHVDDYLRSSGLDLPVVYDSSGRIRQTMGVSATPTTVILDAGGSETDRHTGAVTAAWIERRVLPLLN